MASTNIPSLEVPAVSKGALRTGWILSSIVSLMLLFGALNAFRAAPQVLEGLAHLGFQPRILPIMGVLELVCAVLYLIPATDILGAILLTGYFGGAVLSHLRIGESQWPFPVLFGILTWLGLYLREPRLRRLVPVHR